MHSHIDEVSKIITSHLSTIAELNDYTGSCAFAAYIGYHELKKRGIETTIAFGSAYYSINKSKYGIISFPSAGNEQLGNEFVFGGGTIGHYWLIHKGRIIDFSIPYIPNIVKRLDQQCATPTGSINIPLKPLVSKLKITTFQKANAGKLGFVYEKERINPDEILKPHWALKEGLEMIGYEV